MKNYKKTIKWEDFNFNFSNLEDMEEETEWKDSDGELLEQKFPKIMQTPFGLFEVDDTMNPFRRFEFRIMHTNFDISQRIGMTLEEIPGIEVLMVLSRYRAIIGIGQAFDFRDVRVEIEKCLCGMHQVETALEEIDNEEIRQRVSSLVNDLKNYKYWSIYIFPNGSIEHCYDNKKSNSFLNKCSLLEYAQQVSNGILIENID